MSVPTWEEIVERSLTSPILYRAVYLASRGELTRMQALQAAVMQLDDLRQEQTQRLTEILMQQPVSGIVLRID